MERYNKKILFSKIVYDEDEHSLRIDISPDFHTDHTKPYPPEHYHIELNRKQAIKLQKLIEEFLLWNIK